MVWELRELGATLVCMDTPLPERALGAASLRADPILLSGCPGGNPWAMAMSTSVLGRASPTEAREAIAHLAPGEGTQDLAQWSPKLAEH